MWLSENKSTKLYLERTEGVKNYNLNDIIIACMDSLKDFSDAIKTACPPVCIQLCICVVIVLNILYFISWQDN